MRKILVITAHPDDISFGPSGTIAKYAAKGVEIHALVATRGDYGQSAIPIPKGKTLADLREKEELIADKILGIKKIDFLGFKDGELRQNLYFEIADKIIKKINEFKPDIILTHDQNGGSGHIDHIVVSLTTTYAYLKTKIAKKLYYSSFFRFGRKSGLTDYFIYIPEGRYFWQISTWINTSKFWQTKAKAILCHRTQLKDTKRMISRLEKYPKLETFILKYSSIGRPLFFETDFFRGM